MKQYSDGRQSGMDESGSPKKTSIVGKVVLFVFGVPLALLVFVGVFGTSSPSSDTATSASSAAADASVEPAAPAAQWYPSGFFEVQDGIAAKWITLKSCKYDLGTCFGAKFVSRDGCPNGFYAAVNIEDKGGTIVDFANDALPSLPAMQIAKMEFTSTDDSADSARLSEIQCY